MLEQAYSAQITGSNDHDPRIAQQKPPPSRLDSIAIMMRRNRGEEFHRSEEADNYWYRVISGAAKCSVALPDGRRQIMDLLLPNDFFRCAPDWRHQCMIEAVVNDTAIACYPRRRAEALADSDASVGRQLSKMAFDAISRSQELILILGRTTAREKVASFLLKMMERTAKQSADRLALLASRYEIADYLALSVETVSRSMTDLKDRGLIAMAGPRSVRIIDQQGLEESDFSGSHAPGTRARF